MFTIMTAVTSRGSTVSASRKCEVFRLANESSIISETSSEPGNASLIDGRALQDEFVLETKRNC